MDRQTSVVPSVHAVSFNHGQLPKHGKSIPDDPDLRTGLVRPIHRNLRNAITSPLGHIQELQVESIAVDRSNRKQILGHVSTEQLKAALSVRDSSDAALSDGCIKQSSQESTVQSSLYRKVRQPTRKS